jgi:universal stress protein A
MNPKKILLCADFSENSEPARKLALHYAKTFGAALVIVHAVNPKHLGYPSLEDLPLSDVDVKAVKEKLTKSLEDLAQKSRTDVPDVTTCLRQGRPSKEIVDLANEIAADLIVMGTHGWTGLGHVLVGSTAENVLKTAHRPVLIVWSKG